MLSLCNPEVTLGKGTSQGSAEQPRCAEELRAAVSQRSHEHPPLRGERHAPTQIVLLVSQTHRVRVRRALLVLVLGPCLGRVQVRGQGSWPAAGHVRARRAL